MRQFSSQRFQYQSLMLAPSSWIVQETMALFGATVYTAMASRDLLQHEDVLAKPAPKAVQSLKDVKSLQDFYGDLDISRCCPGA